MKPVTPKGLRLDTPEPLFLALGFPGSSWPALLNMSWEHDAKQLFSKLTALYAHFEIDPLSPGADLDLALSLAFRHGEAFIAASGQIRFSSLYEKYQTDNPTRLAYMLAFKHVPGFHFHSTAYKSRLSTPEVIQIIFAWAAVDDHLQSTLGRSSVRAVADVMVSEKALAKIIPVKAATRVQAIIQRSGNKSRGQDRGLTSRKSFLRGMMREAFTSLRDFKAGRATQFQMQMLAEVFPCISRLISEPGQN